MAVFLLFTGLAVIGINSWSLWVSWEHTLTKSENDARNLSVSLARQAQDAFLQVDITLADAVRQLRQNGPGYASGICSSVEGAAWQAGAAAWPVYL